MGPGSRSRALAWPGRRARESKACHMTKQTSIGFIGLGVMGEPMCRNLARKSGAPVIAFDLRPEPLARLKADGVKAATSARQIMDQAAVIMLSLPSGSEVEAICAGEGGLLARSRKGQTVIDLGTSPVRLMRALAEKFAARPHEPDRRG